MTYTTSVCQRGLVCSAVASRADFLLYISIRNKGLASLLTWEKPMGSQFPIYASPS